MYGDLTYIANKRLHFFCFSQIPGDTPWKGYRKSKGDSHHITSRIVGVEVHCGPVHGTILYYANNMVAGGSNLIIAITRQGENKINDVIH